MSLNLKDQSSFLKLSFGSRNMTQKIHEQPKGQYVFLDWASSSFPTNQALL